MKVKNVSVKRMNVYPTDGPSYYEAPRWRSSHLI